METATNTKGYTNELIITTTTITTPPTTIVALTTGNISTTISNTQHDSTDYLHHRFKYEAMNCSNTNIFNIMGNPFPIDASSNGCISMMEMSSSNSSNSSTLSTPSGSTMSSPLSTPTRLSPIKSLRRQAWQKPKLNVTTITTTIPTAATTTATVTVTMTTATTETLTTAGAVMANAQSDSNNSLATFSVSPPLSEIPLTIKQQQHEKQAQQQHQQQQQQQQQQLYIQRHYQHQHHHTNNTMKSLSLQSSSSRCCGGGMDCVDITTNGSTNLEKRDTQYGASSYRLLFPIIVCILAVTTVFSILVVYMDTTEIHHQQFRLNMSRPYELYGVAQDDPNLIAFLQQIHIPKYSMHFLKTNSYTANSHNGNSHSHNHGHGNGNGNGIANGNSAQNYDTSSTSTSNSNNSSTDKDNIGYSATPAFRSTSHLLGAYPYFNVSGQTNGLLYKMAQYVANLLDGKTNGVVFQSLTGTLGHLMTAPWLVETLNWAALIVEPDPQRYFALDNQNALWPRVRVVHACVSPNSYPKEITIPNEESGVRINSVQESETSWFYSRVKCFPLYSIMLATNRIEYDLLSLGIPGHELEILQTLPFEKVKISVISIHLLDDQEDVKRYENALSKFLKEKSYKLEKKFGLNLFYHHNPLITTKSQQQRSHKKDIVLLKTP